MGVMDFELQRERRADLLREAEDRRLARSYRTGKRGKVARGLRKLASVWVLGR